MAKKSFVKMILEENVIQYLQVNNIRSLFNNSVARPTI